MGSPPHQMGERPAVRLVSSGGAADEEPLVADARGLREAFGRHGPELLGLARRALGDRGSAEEALQETFARAWRARASFDATQGTLRGWLFTIERRIIIDMARSRAARPVTVARGVLAADLDGADRVPTDPIEDLVVGWQLDEALGRLRSEQRQVVEEMCLRGRTGPETARVLGIPEGTVRSRLHHALTAVRRHLEETGWSE